MGVLVASHAADDVGRLVEVPGSGTGKDGIGRCVSSLWNILEATELDLLLASAPAGEGSSRSQDRLERRPGLADHAHAWVTEEQLRSITPDLDLCDLTRSWARLAQWHGRISNRTQKP
jgi:hypothetical protein